MYPAAALPAAAMSAAVVAVVVELDDPPSPGSKYAETRAAAVAATAPASTNSVANRSFLIRFFLPRDSACARGLMVVVRGLGRSATSSPPLSRGCERDRDATATLPLSTALSRSAVPRRGFGAPSRCLAVACRSTRSRVDAFDSNREL